jgi:thiol:disulfide interchange protein
MFVLMINIKAIAKYTLILSVFIVIGSCGIFKPQKETVQEAPVLREILIDDWDKALADSKKENKPIYVEFYTTWCGYCKVFKKKTLSNEEVKQYLSDNFIAVLMDAEKGQGIAAAKKYGVNGYPTHAVIDVDGKLKGNTYGYLKPTPFLNWLKTKK